METTRKKMKILGEQDYINANTGEIVPMNVSSTEERDAYFHKIWLKNTLGSFEAVGNKKVRFINFLFENMDGENKICMTQKQMAEKSRISIDTIRKTIGVLKKTNLITSINMGVYQINPEAIYKGGKSKRQEVLSQYMQSSAEERVSATDVQSAVGMQELSPDRV